MPKPMNFYILYDQTDSTIYHLYYVIKRYDNHRYRYKRIPICKQSDSRLPSKLIANLLSEDQVVEKIKNILDDIENDVRICENCIREIIAQKQDIIFDTESEGYIK